MALEAAKRAHVAGSDARVTRVGLAVLRIGDAAEARCRGVGRGALILEGVDGDVAIGDRRCSRQRAAVLPGSTPGPIGVPVAALWAEAEVVNRFDVFVLFLEI